MDSSTQVGSIKRNPVLAAMSVLATLQLLTGAAAFGDVVGPQIAGLLIVIVAALQYGIQYWVKGEVTPLVDPRDRTGVRLTASNNIPDATPRL